MSGWVNEWMRGSEDRIQKTGYRRQDTEERREKSDSVVI